MAIRKLFSSKKADPVPLAKDDPPIESVPVEEPEIPTYMQAARERMELRRTAEVARQNPPEIFQMEARPAKRQRKERRRGNKKA